ncbi:MAG: class I SAM-dependent methyltransferase [Pseudomonadota bacterium]
MTTEYMNMPLKPTWERYKKIFLTDSGVSIYRALEYEALSRVEYAGRLLDFGGGENAHYCGLLKSWMEGGVYESANISESMRPTYLMSPGENIPVPGESYDMVVSVNTLEHVYELEKTLAELLRVLKPGGKFVFAVPFLFRVHGCPDDYNRPTASWWWETLSRHGVEDLKITPLVWDVMTTGLSVTEGAGPLSGLRKIIVPLYGLVYACVKGRGAGEYYPDVVGKALANVSLGYVITGVK